MKRIFPIGKQDICLCAVHGCCLIIFFFLIGTVSFAAESTTMLQEKDCGKCHLFKLKTITAEGGKHATEVGCLDCHPQHPPKGENTIAACTLCHTGQPHFQIEDCLQCHADPHKPLVSLRDPAKPARKECLSCHADVGQQMSGASSRHAQLFCTHCHNRHGFIPSCLGCHKPHLAQQTVIDCANCHPAHSPLQIVPTGYIPVTFCMVCHKKQASDLAETNTNHRGINCVFCHNGVHPSIPRCQDCHGLPHAKSIHRQYRGCLDCHGDAHRLISNM